MRRSHAMHRCAVLALVLVACGRSELHVPAPTLTAPRPVAPLSTARVTSRRPEFRWALPAGIDRARIDLCRDPQCAAVVHTLDVSGDRTRWPEPLELGTWFWRVRAIGDGPSSMPSAPPWEFFLGARDADVSAVSGAWMDFDRDGHVDFVLVEGPSTQRHLAVHLGRDGGAFSALAAIVLPFPSSADTENTVQTAMDVNGDGFGDLLVSDLGLSPQPRLYLGGRDGLSATRTWNVPTGDDPLYFGGAAAVGDVDGDGYADVVTVIDHRGSPDTYSLQVLRGSPSAWTPGDVRAAFQAVPHRGLILPSSIVGDVDADGFADVVVTDRGPYDAPPGCVRLDGYLFRGERDGISLTPDVLLGESQGTSFGDVGPISGSDDVDGDGRPDVFAGTCASGSAAGVLFDGLPTGLPTQPSQRIDGDRGEVVPIGDINGDGFGDISVRGVFFEGSPEGVSTMHTLQFDGTIQRARGVGDVDGDGFDDVLVEQSVASGLVVRLCHGGDRATLSCEGDFDAQLP